VLFFFSMGHVPEINGDDDDDDNLNFCRILYMYDQYLQSFKLYNEVDMFLAYLMYTVGLHELALT